MRDLSPSFLLGNPDLVAPVAPWCVRLDNLELGMLLLAQPWVAGGGLRRADLERQLAHLARDLPLGPVYFQRVNRAAAKLEAVAALAGRGSGRARRFAVTPQGFAALILNLRVLFADPTVDGSEFELKRALVAMWNLVWERLAQLPDEVELEGDLERFFDEVEALEVLGRRVITDEVLGRALDVLALVEVQRRRVEGLLEAAEKRLAALAPQADQLRGVDLARLAGGRDAGAGSAQGTEAIATALVRHLAGRALPQLSLQATVLRYRGYLDYLAELTRLYAKELRVVDLATVRRITGRGRG